MWFFDTCVGRCHVRRLPDLAAAFQSSTMTKIGYTGYRIPARPPWGDPNVMLIQDRPRDRWLSAKATDFIGISQISLSGFFHRIP